MEQFLESVRRAFQPMIDRGSLSVLTASQDDCAFGNATVILTAPSFRVRLVRDRDDVWADVASETQPDNWFPLERALTAVGALERPEGLLSPDEAAELIRSHWASLDRGLSAAGFVFTLGKLRQLETTRADEALRRMRGR